jgi:lactoylglutathione lyase
MNNFLGLRTAIYVVLDVAKAKEWYAKVLGFPPYFDEPFYVGFNVGGFELGLQPGSPSNAPKAESVVAYWGVEDAYATMKRLVDLGAVVHEEVADVGEGILVGKVMDPFGNIFGIIRNPHFGAQKQ